jgi:hypothetical protein
MCSMALKQSYAHITYGTSEHDDSTNVHTGLSNTHLQHVKLLGLSGERDQLSAQAGSQLCLRPHTCNLCLQLPFLPIAHTLT